MGVIVDTNVWSLAFRRSPSALSASENAVVDELRRLLVRDDAWLPGAVRQEVLTGIAAEPVVVRIRGQLRGAVAIDATTSDHERAAMMSNMLRARGLATTPVDAVLCAVSERLDTPIFTLDRDFERYADVLPITLHTVTGDA